MSEPAAMLYHVDDVDDVYLVFVLPRLFPSSTP